MELTEVLAREGKIVHRTVEVRDRTLNVAATGSADGFGSMVLDGLPKGNILLLATVSYLRFFSDAAGVTATWSGDYSLGTTPTADATLGGTDVDIIASTALDTAVAGLSDAVRAANGTAQLIDNTAEDKEVNLNFKVDNANFPDDGDVDFTVSGAVHMFYVVLGDDAI
jgi:hypothetical protein